MRLTPLCSLAPLTVAMVLTGCRAAPLRQPDAPAPSSARASWGDPSRHDVRSIDVGGSGVEVLDWGGSGPAIVLLAGLGNTAHVFDDFAPALVDEGHVYGITRRGFGASGKLPAQVDVAMLGSDVVHVLDALRIDRASVIGHSFAGEEMTWLGTNARDRMRSLVYLDAAYDRVALDVALRAARHPSTPAPEPAATNGDLHDPVAYTAFVSRGLGMPVPLGEVLATFAFATDGRFLRSAMHEEAAARVRRAAVPPRYQGIEAPVLALFAAEARPGAPPELAAFNAAERAHFAAELPTAHVVVLQARHYLFLTARDEVLSAVRPFISAL